MLKKMAVLFVIFYGIIIFSSEKPPQKYSNMVFKGGEHVSRFFKNEQALEEFLENCKRFSSKQRAQLEKFALKKTRKLCEDNKKTAEERLKELEKTNNPRQETLRIFYKYIAEQPDKAASSSSKAKSIPSSLAGYGSGSSYGL